MQTQPFPTQRKLYSPGSRWGSHWVCHASIRLFGYQHVVINMCWGSRATRCGSRAMHWCMHSLDQREAQREGVCVVVEYRPYNNIN